jgi:predicted CXXCH cytochrome family protein
LKSPTSQPDSQSGRKSRKYWLLWAALSATLAGWLGYGLSFAKLSDAPLRTQARSMFLPGQTTAGHHQIELACDACHTQAMGGREILQDACVNCHGAELKEARDSHPKSKFTDPRNAERAAKLDAAWCVTCHVEHKPQMTHEMGVTLPEDFCRTCHDDVATERPSHKGMAFDTCASAGCHNFHDNRALYEDFLLKHAHDPAAPEKRRLPERDFGKLLDEFADYPISRYPRTPLSRTQADWGAVPVQPRVTEEWFATAHAQAGVNCSACHQQTGSDGKAAWVQRPQQQVCATCHAAEVKGFTGGRHGMRLAQELAPMTAGEARIPMRGDAHDKSLGCATCHAAHRFDTRNAAVDACLTCHNDEHSVAYKQSQHYALWQKELSGELPAGSGVSCASCHLPRIEFRTPDDVKRVLVQHNQNDTLRPNEKMIRPVCMSCHSLKGSVDALADRELIKRNFAGKPAKHVQGIEMALAREAEAARSRTSGGDE